MEKAALKSEHSLDQRKDTLQKRNRTVETEKKVRNKFKHIKDYIYYSYSYMEVDARLSRER